MKTKENNEKIKDILKKLAIVFIATLAICIIFTLVDERPTFADSGFGTDYGGGSSSSGSSYGGGSSSSYSGGSSYSGSISGIDIIFYIIVIIIYCIYLGLKKSFEKPNEQSQSFTEYIPDQEKIVSEIRKYIPDFYRTVFLHQGFSIYKDVQNAWMNFKLEDVKDVITDELYNMYESQLATLEVKGEQNIMKDIVLKNSYLKSITVENKTITIKTGYVIELYDYIADQATGKVKRGNSNKKIRMTYEMSFRKTLDENRQVKYCPNCGAKLNMNSSGTCEYCGSKIVSENTKWVLTEKKVRNQELM